MTRYLTALAIAVVLALSLSGCGDGKEGGQAVRPVRSIVIEPGPAAMKEIFTGQIDAHNYVSVSFRIAGKIRERFVSAGDRVKAGQLLARLDDAVQKDSLTSAQAQVLASKAALEQASKLAGRAESLIGERAVSQNQYDTAIRSRKEATENLRASQASAHSAAEQLSYTILKAPVNGVITNRLAESGENVAAGQAIFRIAQDSGFDAVFDMPTEMIRWGLANGSRIKVCLDSDRNVCATGTVYEVSPEASDTTRTHLTKAFIADCPASMLLGSTVTGEIIEDRQNVIVIPKTALISHNDRAAVWVIGQDSTVSYRAIDIDRYTKDSVYVKSGLSKGDRVVTAGVQVLLEGQKVKEAANGAD